MKIFANKEILKEANLKETSLHIMAENLELDSQKLIKKFIYCEKEGK